MLTYQQAGVPVNLHFLSLAHDHPGGGTENGHSVRTGNIGKVGTRVEGTSIAWIALETPLLSDK